MVAGSSLTRASRREFEVLSRFLRYPSFIHLFLQYGVDKAQIRSRVARAIGERAAITRSVDYDYVVGVVNYRTKHEDLFCPREVALGGPTFRNSILGRILVVKLVAVSMREK